MKPILFNTENVRAILDGRKTVTRRAIKPNPNDIYWKSGFAYYAKVPCDTDWYGRQLQPIYVPGDILYVRETWNYGYCDTTDFEFQYNETFFEEMIPGTQTVFLMPRYFYRTEDLDGIAGMKWRPSIHMPKEAARLFLRVTSVRVERLQDITPEQCVAEGVEQNALDEIGGEFVRGMFNDIWDSTIKKADLDKYGWAANPFVWVIAFERISKEEALKNDT